VSNGWPTKIPALPAVAPAINSCSATGASMEAGDALLDVVDGLIRNDCVA
jgi:hypothetical protein